jgi:cytochrome P450
VRRHDNHNSLSLRRLKQLDDYCYTVAGIVGEMLTTLFALYSPHIEEGRLLYLRTLEIGYAAGLQLTNIIKDSFRDHSEGRHYIPRQYLPVGPNDTSDIIIPILVYAYRHLIEGIEYVLGVPPEDRTEFRKKILRQEQERGGAGIGGVEEQGEAEHFPLAWLYDKFSAYIEDRRRNPVGDILTGLAEATFPDGSIPEPLDVARIAANLFAAGQETTVRLLSYAFQVIGDQPELQQRLRQDRSLIPNFVEECLRIEGPVKGDFRLAKKPTTVGGVDIPAGTFLFIANSAANRDARQFENPGEFQLDRNNARLNVSFGRGRHACPGAPLARAEAVVSLNRMFDRTSDIRVSEKVHGPRDARRYSYLPTFILRGLTHLNLEFDPVSGGSQ